jgi:hypothetical protein
LEIDLFKQFHSLLPVRAQQALMDADKKELDGVIKQVMFDHPYRYHTEESLDKRVFFDQPTGTIGNARFVNAAPKMPTL